MVQYRANTSCTQRPRRSQWQRRQACKRVRPDQRARGADLADDGCAQGTSQRQRRRQGAGEQAKRDQLASGAALGRRRPHVEAEPKPTAMAVSPQVGEASPACGWRGVGPTPAARKRCAGANGDGGEPASEQSRTGVQVAQHASSRHQLHAEAALKPAATVASTQPSEASPVLQS